MFFGSIFTLLGIFELPTLIIELPEKSKPWQQFFASIWNITYGSIAGMTDILIARIVIGLVGVFLLFWSSSKLHKILDKVGRIFKDKKDGDFTQKSEGNSSIPDILNALYKEGKAICGEKALAGHDTNNKEIWGYKIQYVEFESKLSIWTEKVIKVIPGSHKFKFENPLKIDDYSPKELPFKQYLKRMEILYSILQDYNDTI